MRTRAIRKMDGERLEGMTYQEVQLECARYGLPAQGHQNILIDAIMTHLERQPATQSAPGADQRTAISEQRQGATDDINHHQVVRSGLEKVLVII